MNHAEAVAALKRLVSGLVVEYRESPWGRLCWLVGTYTCAVHSLCGIQSPMLQVWANVLNTGKR